MKHRVLYILFSLLLSAGGLLIWTTLAQAYTSDIQAGEIVINEVMVNPGGTDNLREWFEVKNVSSRDLNLGNCTVADGEGSFTISDPTTVTVGSYFLFCGSSGGVTEMCAGYCGYTYTAASGSGIYLANGGDSITITCGSTVLDAINFESVWPGGGPVEEYSFEFGLPTGTPINQAYQANDDGNNWGIAHEVSSFGYCGGADLEDHGTPTYRNDDVLGPNAVTLHALTTGDFEVALTIGVLLITGAVTGLAACMLPRWIRKH